jgi:hypothetical protein
VQAVPFQTKFRGQEMVLQVEDSPPSDRWPFGQASQLFEALFHLSVTVQGVQV